MKRNTYVKFTKNTIRWNWSNVYHVAMTRSICWDILDAHLRIQKVLSDGVQLNFDGFVFFFFFSWWGDRGSKCIYH